MAMSGEGHFFRCPGWPVDLGKASAVAGSNRLLFEQRADDGQAWASALPQLLLGTPQRLDLLD